MKNKTQLERYKRFKEDINIEKVEEVCHYSYRNINRIFQALHHETIGMDIPDFHDLAWVFTLSNYRESDPCGTIPNLDTYGKDCEAWLA